MGHPRKKTVQTALPRQSMVESGINPPKFTWIMDHRAGVFCRKIISWYCGGRQDWTVGEIWLCRKICG